jgi:hypothetical protein
MSSMNLTQTSERNELLGLRYVGFELMPDSDLGHMYQCRQSAVLKVQLHHVSLVAHPIWMWDY